MMTVEELEQRREERGLQIVNNGKSQVNRVSENNYVVRSQSGNGSYLVVLTQKGLNRRMGNGNETLCRVTSFYKWLRLR